MSWKIGIIQGPPNAYPCDTNLTSCPYPGLAIDTALLACQYLQLNCTFSVYPSGEYGDYNETNGNVTGLIGEIYKGEFDSSLPQLLATYSRTRVVSFSNPFVYENVLLVTRAPNDIGLHWDMIYTFQTMLWIILCISIVLISIIITIIQRIQSCKTRSWLYFKCEIFKNVLTLTTTQYNKYYEQDTWPIKILVYFWALSYVVLMGGYTGQLFSQKVIRINNPPYTNLETFVTCVAKGECTVLVPALSWAPLRVILSKESPVSDQLNKAILKNPIQLAPNDQSPETILADQNRYLVWIAGERYLSNYLRENRDKACSFYAVTTPQSNNVAFTVRKNSSVLNKLNEFALLYRESGIAEKIESRYLSSEEIWNLCGERVSQDGVRVKFMDVATVFLFFWTGNIVAVIIFIFERYRRISAIFSSRRSSGS